MWDLYAIIRENNRYALQTMMGGIRLERVRSTIPESWPLEEICKKMRIGPPLLRELIAGFVDIDVLEEFLDIIRRFLPKYEEEILSQRRAERIARFCQIFSREYYPLPVWAPRMNMEQFCQNMPVETMAMSHSEWHEMNMRPGYLMLLSMVVYPYQGCIWDEEGFMEAIREYEDGDRPPYDETLAGIFTNTRVALIDTVQNIVGEIARRVPPEGWTADELHAMTDGTTYDGMGHFAAWAISETGCAMLDSSHDSFEYMEGEGEPYFKWTQNNVEILTREWPKVVEIREKIDRIVGWIEADPGPRFQELLEFLLEESRKLKLGGKRAPREYDPTEHWCPLDQYREDDYDEGYCGREIDKFERECHDF